jgi:hypothetical protein
LGNERGELVEGSVRVEKAALLLQKSYLGREETIEPGLMHILVHLGS